MQYVAQLLRKLKWPEKGEAAQHDFAEIESKAGLILPADYRFFLSQFESFQLPIGKEYIQTWEFEKLLPMNKKCHIFDHFSQTLAIGDNGAGEWIGIEETDDGRKRIILSPFKNPDSKYHIEIGTSFTDFLERLNEREDDEDLT